MQPPELLLSGVYPALGQEIDSGDSGYVTFGEEMDPAGLDPDMFVVSFQNGIGTENFIGKHIDPMKVLRGIVNFAGVRDEESGDVAMSWFIPPNFLGPWQDQDLGRRGIGGLHGRRPHGNRDRERADSW